MKRKDWKFQKLTPTNQVDLGIYETALNFVFENNDIKNVAISGPYSSGKSSLLESYKVKYPHINFLHISLAHFESTDGNEHKGGSETNKGVLEGKILNQLVHQISPKKIPQTNFKVKQEITMTEALTRTIFASIFILSSGFIWKYGFWCELYPKLRTNNIILFVSIFTNIFIVGMAINSIIRSQINKSILKRIHVYGSEIELFGENEDSYFDKYLNEVLYLFDKSTADVIVIDDMDRFNVTVIFEKLREINTLVNTKRDKPIRFFYLLRDDIFVTKDRTKFFDFIVPVVPVIDGSNSYDQFIEQFKNGGILDLFDNDFLQGFLLYVDDMRILKNIYNEFVIYYERIQPIELDVNKLLAMITYKNIFPKDFSDLQLGQGFVHTLFKNKDNFANEEINKIEQKIHALEEEIKLIKEEHLNNMDELDAVFLKIDNLGITVNGKSISHFDTHVQFVKALKKNPSEIKCSRYTGVSFNVHEKLNQLLENPKYAKRKENIEKKTNNKIEDLEFKRQKMKKQKYVIKNGSFKDLITRENIDDIFSVSFKNELGDENKFEEIKASPYFPLIKYLIRHGFINETYADYMTYFYGNSLTRVDKIFLRSVSDKIAKEYSYSLDDPKMVLSRLHVADFDNEETLNFGLLEYLLKTTDNNLEYLTHLLHQLCETKKYDFINGFLEKRKEISLFVKHLNQVCPEVFEGILLESLFDSDQIKQYAVYTLYYSPDEDIQQVNDGEVLSRFISDYPDFLKIEDPDVDKIISGFKLIDVCFEWINYDVSNKELFEAVYSKNLYKLNFPFISLMLEKMYGFSRSNDFNTKNYTLTRSKIDEPLAQYVHDNINLYVEVILDNCRERIDDDEMAVLELLNNLELDKDRKVQYIGYLQTVKSIFMCKILDTMFQLGFILSES